LAFQEKVTIYNNICVYNKVTGNLTALNILVIIYIRKLKKSDEILDYNREMKIMDEIFKPNLFQIYTRIRIFKTLESSTLI